MKDAGDRAAGNAKMSEQIKQTAIQTILKNKIIAVLRRTDPDEALRIMEALYKGGIRVMELPFDQSDAASRETTAEIIRKLTEESGGAMLIGAGTVTLPGLVDLACEAGARFIVSPDTNDKVIRRTLENNLVSIPGAMTPTEILAAHRAGADFVKVFPAGYLGTAYLKMISKPINHVRLLGFGGIDESNIVDFMKAGLSGVGVSGCLFGKERIDKRKYGCITQSTRKLVLNLNPGD